MSFQFAQWLQHGGFGQWLQHGRFGIFQVCPGILTSLSFEIALVELFRDFQKAFPPSLREEETDIQGSADTNCEKWKIAEVAQSFLGEGERQRENEKTLENKLSVPRNETTE